MDWLRGDITEREAKHLATLSKLQPLFLVMMGVFAASVAGLRLTGESGPALVVAYVGLATAIALELCAYLRVDAFDYGKQFFPSILALSLPLLIDQLTGAAWGEFSLPLVLGCAAVAGVTIVSMILLGRRYW